MMDKIIMVYTHTHTHTHTRTQGYFSALKKELLTFATCINLEEIMPNEMNETEGKRA